MLKSIKKYLAKAKEEVAKEYTIGPSKTGQPDPTQPIDGSVPELPKTWIGVDLDGTLAHYDENSSLQKVGEPVPAMLALVKKMIHNGIRVKIFTARATDPDQFPIIRTWLAANGLPELEITNVKDYFMLRLYDDRCVQVEKNTGRLMVERSNLQGDE